MINAHIHEVTVKHQVIDGCGRFGWVLTKADGAQRVMTWREVLVWKCFNAWPHDAVQRSPLEELFYQAQHCNRLDPHTEQLLSHAGGDWDRLKASGNLKDRTDGVQ